MSDMENLMKSVLKSTGDLLHTEDVIVDAMNEMVRDEIKSMIRQKIDEDPQLRAEIKDAIQILIEAKAKEAFAMIKLAKCGSRIGLNMIPNEMRQEMTKEIIGVFEKELTEFVERTI